VQEFAGALMDDVLTAEQQAVVNHPQGKHARVLAVAGAGKTTTMVYRVKHLVETMGISPRQVCILMFNRRARFQFKDKLDPLLPSLEQPQVHTFHSYASSLIMAASNRGLLPPVSETWAEEKEEVIRLHVHYAIENLIRGGVIPSDTVDPDDAMECIGLWKGSLIPPDRAGHRTNPFLPLVYREYERLRIDKNALTYDDFVPLVVDLLESNTTMSREIKGSFEAVIVDEYQDVNYGQQRLIELVAGKRADIMVVGDDDQTIYEWRGARPSYIVSEFSRLFGNKSAIDYKLSRTFRFGPVIAQSAQNVIAFNHTRIPKSLIAHQYHKPAAVFVIQDTVEQPTDVHMELAAQVFALVRATKAPRNVIVLARMFSQLTGLEAEFLNMGIPYRVLGRAPFFERREIVVLLDYLRLAACLYRPADQTALNWLLSVANVPNRRLSKDLLSRSLKHSAASGGTVHEGLRFLTDDNTSPLSYKQRDQLDDFILTLEWLNEVVVNAPDTPAGKVLKGLVFRLDYEAHFDNYYGNGENSEDRKRSVLEFCAYASKTRKSVPDFLMHIESLDTTRGYPEDQQIIMTTIFRVKGEEFDYVIIPNCDEGYMPCLFNTGNAVFDTQGIVAEPSPSEGVETERRLFYVAVTRARVAVLIGASAAPQSGRQASSRSILPSRFIEEMQLDSTLDVMDAFQRAVSGDEAGLGDLRTAISRHAGRKTVLYNLLSVYLPSSGLTLPPHLIRTIQSTTEVPFKYSTYFPANRPAVPIAPANPSNQANWWD
jgi:DNA helicase II / ATP-dependent DNA helicase PcrA